MSESGHAKNLSNFSQLVTIVTNLGRSYAPSNPQILLAELQTALTAAQNALNAVTPKETAEMTAVNERQTAFEPLNKLVTRVTNSAGASVNDELFSNDLRTLSRKLQGKRAAPKPPDNPLTLDIDESKQAVSASQLSYDNRTANFAEFIDLLKSNAAYNPNEPELKTAALDAMLADMQAKNQAVITATTQARAARIARDEVLYNAADGIKALADLVKKYVKSVFGAQSPQLKQLQALKFKKP